MQPYNTISPFCVPVSTAEDHCPGLATQLADSGELDMIFRAINLLKSYGWTVGCDSELLAPLWLLEGM